MLRGGITYKRSGFRSTLQGSYVTEHYTDATNAVRVAGSVNGIIPTYHVLDFRLGTLIKKSPWKLVATIIERYVFYP